jgi:hypothetical protein
MQHRVLLADLTFKQTARNASELHDSTAEILVIAASRGCLSKGSEGPLSRLEAGSPAFRWFRHQGYSYGMDN